MESKQHPLRDKLGWRRWLAVNSCSRWTSSLTVNTGLPTDRPLWTHSKAECNPGQMSATQFVLPNIPSRCITPFALGINNPDGKSKASFLGGGPSATEKLLVRESEDPL